MFRFIRDNRREIVFLFVTLTVLFFALGALGRVEVAESRSLSTLVALGVSLLQGVVRFCMVLALGWFGLAVTFPEANRFIASYEFDHFWERTPVYYKGYIALAGVAALGIMAAICMAA